MTDQPADETTAKPVKNSGWDNLKPFKPGYDPRRWMKGRGKKSPTMKEAEKIFGELIWDILSEEITNPVTGDKVDRFRAMLRSMTTSRQSADKQAILDRILGKVAQSVDVTTNGKDIEVKDSNAGFERAISQLADALREIVPQKSGGQNGEVDTSK